MEKKYLYAYIVREAIEGDLGGGGVIAWRPLGGLTV